MLISFSGKLRSGKDTVADILVDKFGFVKLQWGHLVHDVLMAQNPILTFSAGRVVRYADAIAEFGYNETKDRFPEARIQLQRMGTEVGRVLVGEDVWVDRMRNKILERHEHDNIVITGTRFQNELDMVHDLGGESVWVERPGTAASSHASESSLAADSLHYYIDNSGDLDDLEKSTIALYSLILERAKNE